MKSVPVEQNPPFRGAKLKFFVKYLMGAFKYFMGEKRIIFGPWSMDHSPWLFWVDFGDYRLLTGSPLPNHGLPSSSCHGPWTNSSSCYGPWTMDYGLWTMDYGPWTSSHLQNNLPYMRTAFHQCMCLRRFFKREGGIDDGFYFA